MIRVAIIGAGIAGLGAARALDPSRFAVTLYDASPRAGGHVHTVDVGDHAIDMGFIVCNRERYPRFFALLAELGVATRPTTMAFSVALPARDLEWGSASLSAVFADRRRLLDPAHWRFGIAVLRLLARMRADRARNALGTCSLDDYLGPADAAVREQFVVPLAAALWSLAPDRCGAFPARTFVEFLAHHGMLSPVRPLAWHTVVGGSRTYVDALVARLRARPGFTLRLATPIGAIVRNPDSVDIVEPGGERATFDRAIVATHADTALALLAEPTAEERRVLGAFSYSTNRTVLHGDPRFLPRHHAALAAWNYVADPDTARVAVTYSMNLLQGVPGPTLYLVTLNPRTEPSPTFAEATFTHPQFDAAALAAQPALARLGERASRRVYYAGAYEGFGFHEDGLRSGECAASRLAVDAAV